MSGERLGPGPNTRVRRLPEKARYESDVVFSILDSAQYCHVAGIVDGLAMALPTLHARDGRTLYLHGSKSNAVLKSVLDAKRACVTATLYEGLRLARSGFESSIAYRSVVVVGTATLVEDLEEKRRILDLFVDAVLPGRASEVRATSEQELRLTMVVAVAIDEASAKVSEGPTDDDDVDRALPIWSGTVPAQVHFSTPVASTDGAMADGDVPIPASVRSLLERQR
jgi:nitroimidazol reductase NimA-like FMN-containing flavoprotein (pyridoxamine 5'-phosphate oxidase superfamily)